MSEHPQRGRYWRWLLRAAVTGLLVAGLLWVTDLGEVAESISHARFTEFALATVVWIASSGFMAWRWLILLAVDGVRLPFVELLLTHLESTFFSLFLPSAVGGDVFRGLRIYKHIGGATKATVNLLSDRLVGIWGICAYGIAGLFLAAEQFGRIGLVLITAIAILTLVSLAIAHPKLHALSNRLLGAVGLGRLQPRHDEISRQLVGYFTKPGTIGRLFSLSLLQQLLSIVAAYLCGMAAGVELSFVFYMTAMPLVWLASLIPALGGIGPREASLIIAMIEAGADKQAAIAAAGLLLATQIIRSLVGGGILLVRSFTRS